MGIKTLLKFLRPICHNDTIYNYKKKTFGMDMSCYIYKALYHDNVIKHIFLYINLVLKVSSHLYLVFDGKAPESKREEHEFREQCNVKYSRNRRITSDLIKEIVERCQNMKNVTIIYSPEESDSQLAYLNKQGLVDVVITEDSDMIVRGCETVIFKLKPRGDCVVYQKTDFDMFSLWDFSIFRWICILVGCDYLNGGLKGFGFSRATKVFIGEKFKNPMSHEDFKTILKEHFQITDEFFDSFKKADDSFKNQNVYDPTEGVIKGEASTS